MPSLLMICRRGARGHPEARSPAARGAAAAPLGRPRRVALLGPQPHADPKYALLVARLLLRRLTPAGRRMVLDGMVFLGPRVTIQIGRHARVRFGRWVWIGHGTKIRCHEGEVSIGAKTVLGQECTISAYQHVSIGEQCILADRVMLIDFDHNVTETERPIRVQGIYKRDTRVGSNVWIGHGGPDPARA